MEEDALCCKDRWASHGDAWLSLRAHPHSIRLFLRQELHLMGEDGRGVPIFSQAQEHNIKDGESSIKRKLRAHKPRVILCFTLGELFSCDAVYLILRNGDVMQERSFGHPIVAFSICGRDAAFVYPIEVDTRPINGTT